MTTECFTNAAQQVAKPMVGFRAHRFSLFALMILLVAFASLTYAADAPSQTSDFSIEPQEVETALHEWSRQADVQVMVGSTEVAGQRTAGVSGRLSAANALSRLLRNTNLTYETVGGNTVTVKRVAATQIVEPEEVAPERADSQAGGDSKETDNQRIHSSDARESATSRQRLRGALEEVVVTAQKREERLQDVPISISVLGGEALDRSSYSAVNEMLRTVPGIASYENAQAAGMTKFAVRGVTSHDSPTNGSATVGYYLDEIPFAFVRFPVSPDVNAFDLERVEVLRGPQGTLYGANALNGVVRVMTKDANLDEAEFSARTTLSSTDGGGENYRVDAALSLPLIPGKLAARAVAGYADYTGWIDQPATGFKDVNDMEQKNLRVKLNAVPTEHLDVEFLSWFSRDDRGSNSLALDDMTTLTTFPEAVASEFDAFGLTLTYELPALSILSATSYMDFSGNSLLDFPLGVDQLITALTGKLMSEEIRVNSRSEGPWRWSVGGIYRDEEDSVFQDLTRNTIPSFSGLSKNTFKSASFAFYGEVSRLFFDKKLELTGGLRYFEDDSSSEETSTFNPLGTPFGEQKDKFDAVTPRVVLSFRPSEGLTYYASYSEGFRSGFAQQGLLLSVSQGIPAVDADRLKNYELGTKGHLFDGRLTYELATYYIDWKDAVQVLAVPVPNTNVTLNAPVNSEGIDGFGVDFATGFKLSKRLQVDATFSWNELAFSEDVFSGATRVFPEGSRPVSSPKMNASAGLSYLFPSIAGYSTQFTGSASYTAEMPGPFVRGVRLNGDNLLVARASLNVTAPAHWSGMIFADNFTNEDGRVRANTDLTGSGTMSDRLRPRTFGVQLDYRF